MEFEGVNCAAGEIVKCANEKLQEKENCELVVQVALSERRIKKEKGCQESWQMMSSWHKLIPIKLKYTMSL